MKKLIWPAFLLLIFFLSVGLIAYGWWISQIERGNRLLRQGDLQEAANIFRSAEAPFLKAPWLTRVLKDDYQRLALNQVAILYARGNSDGAMEKLGQATATAPFLAETGEYSFWTGNILLRRAVQSKNAEASLNALKTALTEYQKGLVAQPDEW